MAKSADGSATWSKSAINYIQNLALQLYLNEYTSRPDNDATRWGMRNEDKALIERDQQALDQLESVLPEAIVLRNEFLEEYRNGPLHFTFRFER